MHGRRVLNESILINQGARERIQGRQNKRREI